MKNAKWLVIPAPTEGTLKRFWPKVNKQAKDGCWEWIAASGPDGYGNFSVGGKIRRTHRISYTWFVGPIPQGMSVLHRCDNPPCINPEHLFIGSQRDNVNDCIRKNRRSILLGEAHGKALFTDEQVKLIRGVHKEFGVQASVLAEWTGVERSVIHAILTRKNWRHI